VLIYSKELRPSEINVIGGVTSASGCLPPQLAQILRRWCRCRRATQQWLITLNCNLCGSGAAPFFSISRRTECLGNPLYWNLGLWALLLPSPAPHPSPVAGRCPFVSLIGH